VHSQLQKESASTNPDLIYYREEVDKYGLNDEAKAHAGREAWVVHTDSLAEDVNRLRYTTGNFLGKRIHQR
jgi:hypothetical protein